MKRDKYKTLFLLKKFTQYQKQSTGNTFHIIKCVNKVV